MPETIQIQGDTLIWARLSLGLSSKEAADLIDVTLPIWQGWEISGATLTMSELRRVASKLKKPVAAFLRTTTPTLPSLPEDFRTIGGAMPHLTFDALVAIQTARRIQKIATALVTENSTLLPQMSLSAADLDTDDPQELASGDRHDVLSVSPDVQLNTWRVVNTAYNGWRAQIQRLGVLVLVTSMNRADCRGFSLYREGMVPVIVVNQKEVDQAKIFTMLHEFGHLRLRRHGICLEKENVDKRDVERWCNEYAASVLVPNEVLARLAPRRSLTIEDVGHLAGQFKVSRPTIALSLKRIGRATDELYQDLKARDEEVDWSSLLPANQEEFPRRAQDQIRLAELGFAFPLVVFGALREGLIEPTEACEFLDVRGDKLEDLRLRAEQTRSRYS